MRASRLRNAYLSFAQKDLKHRRLQVELLEPRLNMALDVPAFSSLPGANHTIYLDFDGHVTTGTSWNNSYGATINSPAYSSDADTANFSAAELQVIERTYRRVAEDFTPFQVNVTTVPPVTADLINSGGTDSKWGIRVVVTRDTNMNCGCGGIAYINSFTWNSDTPVFVYNTSEIGVAEAASHEVGHSLGLSHDGTSTSTYYTGHGLDTDTSYWSSIMGVGYYVDVSHWDKGEYFGTNNGGSGANYGRGPDDLAIMTTYNGFGYKADDHGNDSLTATSLTVSGTNLSGSGVISTRADVDYFRFSTGAGTVTLNANAASIGANLDIEATLYDTNGNVVASNNPLLSMNAAITVSLAAGEYFLKIDGVGAGNPTVSPPTGYTDYASLGDYTISGTFVPVTGGAVVSVAAVDASKNEGSSGATDFAFTITRTGDTSGASTVNWTVAGSGASPANAADFVNGVFPSGSVQFAADQTSQTILVSVQGDSLAENNETFVVALSNPSLGTSIGTGTASSTIVNDDVPPAPPSLSISAKDANKAEGSGTGSTPFVFTVTRGGDLSGVSSVRYAVSGGVKPTASSGDFTGGFVSNVLVNFPAGVATVDITVNVKRDNKRENSENFKVTLSNATGATISNATALGVIVNDDGTAAAAASDQDDEEDLIAVADPLWMFVPPEMLPPQFLAIPVITWINGIPQIGDWAHEHAHDEIELDFDHDHFDMREVKTESLAVVSAAPSIGNLDQALASWSDDNLRHKPLGDALGATGRLASGHDAALTGDRQSRTSTGVSVLSQKPLQRAARVARLGQFEVNSAVQDHVFGELTADTAADAEDPSIAS